MPYDLILCMYVSGIHEKSFITFMCSSELYMLMSTVLLHKGRVTKTLMTNLEVRSLKYKKYLTAINMISFAIAGYCFLRHNAYCESGGMFYGNKTIFFHSCMFIIIYLLSFMYFQFIHFLPYLNILSY